ncbi:hypothetical protein [Streptomyces europaeiscabiei]|uniref:hypothetical protein n=1 Tax=Streptomyces europaeiscabiei TaxID=146819 RepID=UPI0029BEFBF7|nr:hypothetical protein [Streptomyces europaeiscabiei]MDX3585630.1 hypothetical protein [Streptomyces europaeiscabiei]
MKPVFPYPTLFGDVDLEVMSVTVDDAQLPYSNVSKTERTVALHQTGREKWDQATLRLKATLPDQELADSTWSDVVCLAVLSEKATNARTTARLTRARDGSWQGTIDLARAVHLNRAVLGLTVVATVGDVAGRVIGTTDLDWYVDLKVTTPVRQREIEIVEVDFREGPLDWLLPFKESSWIVETTGDIPTVYLNTTAVEGLMEVLGSTGGSPAEKLLRDMTASQIAQDAWTAMFHTAISDLDIDGDGSPVMPGGWREPVLRMMLPDVLPGRQLTDALYDINERRTQGFGWSELQTNVQYAAGKRSQITRKLTNAVRSVDRAERSAS